MHLITFLSDFGMKDYYVAAVKAKLLSALSDVRILDITHQVNPLDIMQAAYLLKNSLCDFPAQSIHLVSVRSEVTPDQSAVLAKSKNQWILGTDNGLIPLATDNQLDEIWLLKSDIDSFPAKNILAETAIKLVKGEQPEQWAVAAKELNSLKFPQARANEQQIIGQVLHVDHYGNLITNIEKEQFEYFTQNKQMTLKVGGRYQLRKISKHYEDSSGGDIFALFNSSNQLEIGLFDGHAARLLGMDVGSNILINITD